MKYLIKFFLIGVILFVGCQFQTNSVTPPLKSTVIVPPTPAPKTPCEQAQARLESLCLADAASNQYCCAVVMVTKKGKPFAQFCEEEQAKNVFINPECLASITNCDDIDLCATPK